MPQGNQPILAASTMSGCGVIPKPATQTTVEMEADNQKKKCIERIEATLILPEDILSEGLLKMALFNGASLLTKKMMDECIRFCEITKKDKFLKIIQNNIPAKMPEGETILSPKLEQEINVAKERNKRDMENVSRNPNHHEDMDDEFKMAMELSLKTEKEEKERRERSKKDLDIKKGTEEAVIVVAKTEEQLIEELKKIVINPNTGHFKDKLQKFLDANDAANTKNQSKLTKIILLAFCDYCEKAHKVFFWKILNDFRLSHSELPEGEENVLLKTLLDELKKEFARKDQEQFYREQGRSLNKNRNPQSTQHPYYGGAFRPSSEDLMLEAARRREREKALQEAWEAKKQAEAFEAAQKMKKAQELAKKYAEAHAELQAALALSVKLQEEDDVNAALKASEELLHQDAAKKAQAPNIPGNTQNLGGGINENEPRLDLKEYSERHQMLYMLGEENKFLIKPLWKRVTIEDITAEAIKEEADNLESVRKALETAQEVSEREDRLRFGLTVYKPLS